MDRSWRKGQVNDGRRFGEGHDPIYALLGRLDGGLMLDVGAAVGVKTREMLKHSPNARVVAYEPFPGNLPYLTQFTGGDGRVTVRPVAVADRPGSETLNVGRVATATTGGLPMPGFSAVGRLGWLPRRIQVKVEVVRLDDEIAEHVRLLKIDVQGAELRVLEGARQIMARHGIDVCYVEFDGSLRLLRFLEENGYVLFDSRYLAWPWRLNIRNWFRRKPSAMPNWPGMARGRNTMGGATQFGWPPVPYRSFRLYALWIRVTRTFRAGLQTDLLCVHESFLERLFDAAQR